MQQLSSASLGPRLTSDAKRGGIAPLWVIADEEPLLALESADAIRSAARGLGYEEREVLTLSSNSDWNQISVAVAAISLFASKKIVEPLPGYPRQRGAFGSWLPSDRPGRGHRDCDGS